jgi:arginyl-tRNA synthetase
MKDALRSAMLHALASVGVAASDVVIEHPADITHGDYATSAPLQYAKLSNMAPRALAEKLVAALGTIDGVAKIEIAGPGFINFTLAPSAIASSIEQARAEDTWGANATLKGKKVMVEYTDPNPFKEFHIGHLMANAVGEAISRVIQYCGAEVKRANYQGDVGPHVAKALWGLKKLGLDPHSVADIGKAYVAGAKAYEEDAAAKQEIDEINKKVYDHSDGEIDSLYAAGRKVTLAHFEELYKILGTKFDYYFFESVTAPKGLEIVRAHPRTFEQSDGAIVYKGEKAGLHTRVFITSQGLPTYETKELGLAMLKEETWAADSLVTVTAHEQSGYFAVVLAAMREVMPDTAAKIRHLSHGMMRFAEGKMSSRTGNVITGESLLSELTEVARERAKESRADNAGELAAHVAVAAIKYQILKQTSGKDIIFDRERALSLEGDSGPYLQYAHARAHQIVERAKAEGVAAAVDANAAPSEVSRLVHRFPEIVEHAAALMEPHVVATYLITLAGAFNSWYAQEQIVDGTPAAAHKVALTAAFARTMKNGLWLLGIPAPVKM